MTSAVVPLLQHLIDRRNVVIAELRHIDELLGLYLVPYAPAPVAQTAPDLPPSAPQSVTVIPAPVTDLPARQKRQFSPEALERMRQTAAAMRARKAAKQGQPPERITPAGVAESLPDDGLSGRGIIETAPEAPVPNRPSPSPVDLSPLAAIATHRKTMTPAEFAAKRMAEKQQAPRPPAPQPTTRMEAIMAVSRAAEAKTKLQAPEEPISASFEFVARWAGERGISFKEWDDLSRVNAKRETLGLPTFKREFPTRGVRG